MSQQIRKYFHTYSDARAYCKNAGIRSTKDNTFKSTVWYMGGHESVWTVEIKGE